MGKRSLTICVAIGVAFGVFFRGGVGECEVLGFPGSFKQTNNVFNGKLSGCHMDEEPTTS